MDVAAARIVDAPGTADLLGRDKLHAASRCLRSIAASVVVAELVAVRAEQLDAIVGERIVRGGDHHAEVGAHRPRQHRDRRRRHRPEQHDVHADRGEAGDHRRFHHVAGKARVLADHDSMAMIAAKEVRARRLADAQSRLGRHRLAVGEAADPVGTEEFPCHCGGLARLLLQRECQPIQRQMPTGNGCSHVARRNSRVPPTKAAVARTGDATP